jgi:hypothetical protein
MKRNKVKKMGRQPDRRILSSLILLIFIAALCLSGCASALEVDEKSLLADPTITVENPTAASPSPTATLPVYPTQTPTQTRFPAILSAEQAQRLHTAALAYLAENEPDAIKMAKSMNFLGVNGYPSTMCGPLAIAILRDAGLLDSGLNLRDFFYMDPRPGRNEELVANTFSDDYYQKIEINQPVNTVDYSKTPLMAGDFIYLYSGTRGNFDHIITVDYVDARGRAYAMTNLNTTRGYIISEVMLYDPANPGVGQLYEWTDKKNSTLGLTGFGGMWIWRLRETPAEPDAQTQAFRQNTIAEQKNAGGEWHIYIQEIGKDPLYSTQARQSIHPASTIKIADAVLFFKALEKKNVTDIPAYIKKYGTASRTFEQLLHSMLVNSEEAATSAVEDWTAQILDPNQTIHDLGFPNTFITPRQSTAEEMARLLVAIYDGQLVNPTERQIILDYLAEITQNDSTLIGVIRPNLGPQDILYDKRGEISSQRTIVADLGLLCTGGKTYIISIYAYHDTENNTGTFKSLQNAVENISIDFWETIQKDSP